MMRIFRKRDGYILLGVIAAALVWYAATRFAQGEAAVAVITVDGKTVAELSLAKDGEYTAQTEYGYNKIVVENGEAYITEADCPDGLCIRQGRISKDGQTLVCLPHRLVVTARSSEKSGVDAVVS